MFAQVVHGETICFRGQEVKGQGQVRLKTYLEAAWWRHHFRPIWWSRFASCILTLSALMCDGNKTSFDPFVLWCVSFGPSCHNSIGQLSVVDNLTQRYTYLRKGCYVIGTVCLSVCQSVSSITEKVISRFHWNLMLWLALLIRQGAYNSGKHGKLREFKIYSGNLYDTISWASSYVHNCQ